MKAADSFSLGERIKRARQLAGYTQTEVAELLGKSRSTIAEIEGGRRRVDSLLLRDLASLFGSAPSELLGPSPEPRSATVLREALFRSVSEDGVSARDRKELATFWQTVEQFARLAEKAGRLKPNLPGIPHPARASVSQYVIDGAANDARAWLMGGHKPVNWELDTLRKQLEEQGVPVFLWPLERDGISGLTLNHPRLGSILLVNASQLRWRQLFTLAHELGHVWLHRDQQVVISRTAERSPLERQADAFAAEFLMPEAEVKKTLARLQPRGELNVAQIVALHRVFGVSYKAMLVRLRRLRIIQEEQFQRLSEVPPVSIAARLGYKVDPTEVGEVPEVPFYERYPREYLELVFGAWEAGEIGEGRVAQLLNTDRHSLNKYVRRVEATVAAQQKEEVPM
ncbi:MAG: ImmA/IrrE family metallo-endopeptidase [Candidatus Bipolaricaulota bacterium]